MKLHILQVDEKPELMEYPEKQFTSLDEYGIGMLTEQIDAELPGSFEDLDESSIPLSEDVNHLRESYEGKLFSFADDGGNWISVSEEQKQTAKEYWDELKQYPLPDMFQVITWRFHDLKENMNEDDFSGFFDIHTWQFVEWVAEIAKVDTHYHFIQNLESHI